MSGIAPILGSTREVGGLSMITNLVRGAMAVGLACLISACDTTSVGPYRPSVENIVRMRSVIGPQGPVTVGAFDRAPNVDGSPTCRGLGPVDVAPGGSVERYIHDAFQTEIFEAGLLGEGASATVINGRIEEFSLSTLNTGRWTIGLRLFSPANPTGVLVRVDYQFSTSWMADAACANAAMAFGPAVNALIAQALNDEALPLLLRGLASGPAAPAAAH